MASTTSKWRPVITDCGLYHNPNILPLDESIYGSNLEPTSQQVFISTLPNAGSSYARLYLSVYFKFCCFKRYMDEDRKLEGTTQLLRREMLCSVWVWFQQWTSLISIPQRKCWINAVVSPLIKVRQLLLHNGIELCTNKHQHRMHNRLLLVVWSNAQTCGFGPYV